MSASRETFAPGPKTQYIYDLAANLKSGIAKGAFGPRGEKLAIELHELLLLSAISPDTPQGRATQ